MLQKNFKIGLISQVVSKFRIHESQRSNDNNGAPMLNDLATIQRRYKLNPWVQRRVLFLQRIMLLYGACMDDMCAGDVRMAWRRVALGTWRAKCHRLN
jgi:hypothetical protein